MLILVELWKESLKSDGQQFHKYQQNLNLRAYFSLSPASRRTLKIAFMQCHFDYACSSWYTGVSQALTEDIKQHSSFY